MHGRVTKECDVAIIGGAFTGASTALLLRREKPDLRVLVIERKEKFDRKVGEATTEVSGCFLTKRLGLAHHLNNHHITKQGLRFWFAPTGRETFDECSEVGTNFQAQLPSYQVDREVLDTHVLECAREEGAEVWRPATVRTTRFSEDGVCLEVQREGGSVQVQARWVVDASGRASHIARSMGQLHTLSEHPTSAIWARLRGVKDWDGHEMRREHPEYARSCLVSRACATNHLTGYGWWCWIIPLRGGDYSVGLVYDERLYTPPQGANLGERLMAHLMTHPVGRELFSKAECIPGDVRTYSHLPYYAEKIAGPRWQLAGDAAGFMDPLYSQGLDYCSWTVNIAVERILREMRGETVDLDALNAAFRQSYRNWFHSLYKDKYHYLGDPELMTAAFLMDIGLFFFGPVRTVVQDPAGGFGHLPFTGPVDTFVGRWMALYNRRFSHIALQRRQRGHYLSPLPHRRLLLDGFRPRFGVWKFIFRGLRLWARIEIRELLPNRRKNEYIQQLQPAAR